MIETIAGWLNIEDQRELIWVLFGLGGQFLFMSRFLIQWIATERARESTIPTAFWYLSIMGGMVLLIYAIYRRDPVFMLGQSIGVFIYARNLWFIRNKSTA